MFLNYILKEGVFTHVRTKISIWRGRFSPLWMSCGSGLQVIGLPSEEGRTMPQSLPLRPSAALVSSGTGEGCWGAPEGDAGKGCWEGHGGHQPALRRGWLTGCLVLLELREEEQRSASSLGDGVCLPSLGCSKQAESGRDLELCVAGGAELSDSTSLVVAVLLRAGIAGPYFLPVPEAAGCRLLE